MLSSRGRLLRGIGLLARLGLAAVWLISGAIKVADPGQTYLAVQAYDVLPEPLVGVVATAMPLAELVFGALLLFGAATRLTALASAALLVVFIAGVAQSWARGLTIDCGCFGGGGEVEPGETAYPEEIARDIGFLALAVWLSVRPTTPLSVDGWLRRGREASDAVTQPSDEEAARKNESRKDSSGRSGADGEEAASTAVGGQD
ncbi:DoxX family protein [Saccharomonospora azurea]|uniref:DoxX family protein n=1 Tax=Saccharomonospora azurea TaxID=40988 RepID=UPI00024009F3|nr:MauE/DoxX family redox-associated membrane protein [Saccharomonospora azurea]EHK88070.1 DoxX protein [Saccharomonospora azurea SZMC 14600]